MYLYNSDTFPYDCRVHPPVGGGGGRDEGQFFVKFETGKEGRMGPRPHDLFLVI